MTVLRTILSTRQRSQGFTLIELLVVMVIMGIIASVAVLSLGALGRDPPAEKAARQIADLAGLAAQEAVMQGQEYGLRIEPHSYKFLVYDGRAWSSPTDGPLSGSHVLDDSIKLALTLEGAPVTLAAAPASSDAPATAFTQAAQTASSDSAQSTLPQVLLLSSGELTPFTLAVDGPQQGANYSVTGSLLKGIQMAAPDEHTTQ